MGNALKRADAGGRWGHYINEGMMKGTGAGDGAGGEGGLLFLIKENVLKPRLVQASWRGCYTVNWRLVLIYKNLHKCFQRELLATEVDTK